MPVAFLYTRLNQCRFPVAGEGLSLIVCGKPTFGGKSYCPDCYAVAYQPARQARPVRCEYVRDVQVADDRTPDVFEAIS